MGKLIDLTGKKFGRLTVIERTDKKKNKDILWKCKCDCGNECEVRGFFLRSGQTKSCGCLKKETDKQPKGNVIDMTGKKYGHYTVIERAGSSKDGEAMWLCECDCPAHTRNIIIGRPLREGRTTSCGCEKRSRGEQKIAKILFDNNIPFEQEKEMFKFSSGRQSRFDFYVNNKYLIEFDGIQHFQLGHGWNTDRGALEKTQERDMIKNQWCKDNNIPLIRIPYTHYDSLCIEDLQLETSKYIVGND